MTDDHVRDSWGIGWFRVVITDHDENEYRFTTCATVTTLRILGPCPHCGGDVPISEGTELAALGRYRPRPRQEMPTPVTPPPAPPSTRGTSNPSPFH
ncbi:hypothetical protein [Amycolatopsis sp. NBC_01480]|uniref:hypothetical protein n=1 Tax=Amycolatopsis sp. NBC_01480 TaxID=2903562 RepID=UPI002E2B7428|nr:hypothetical protein [Amycolatopsis sp. NBC_01480]